MLSVLVRVSDDPAPMASGSVLYHFLPQCDYLENKDIRGVLWYSAITLPCDPEQGTSLQKLTSQLTKWGE